MVPDLLLEKKDSKNHGFGIDNARTVVEKYDGSIEFSFLDNTFMVSLFLLQRKPIFTLIYTRFNKYVLYFSKIW